MSDKPTSPKPVPTNPLPKEPPLSVFAIRFGGARRGH
jgi:hypothetical protein